MADRIVMGYWDCKYCGTSGIEGIRRDCPNCGHPRDKDTRFYMKSRTHEEVVSSNEYLTDKQAAQKCKGPDWECSYCGALNSTLSSSCKSCGHTREESDLNYFQMRAREDAQNSASDAGTGSEDGRFYHPPAAEYSRPDSASDSLSGSSETGNALKAEKGKPSPLKKIIIAAIILLAIFGIVWAVVPHPKTLHVLNKSWKTSVYVEEYRYVPDSGWSLPSGADLDRTAREIHHYNSVLDHYETKTRTYQVRIQTGSHTEYSYSDNGDGTFTERSYSVPDYGYETRTETYQDPVYIQVPVYQTKYYYHLWRWEYARSVDAAGANREPFYGELNLKEKERKSGSDEWYYVTAYVGDKSDSAKTYSISKSDWYQIKTGTDVRVKVSGSRIEEIMEGR